MSAGDDAAPWQPIATAPRTDRVVQLFAPAIGVVAGFYDDVGTCDWWTFNLSPRPLERRPLTSLVCDLGHEPTHWRELSNAPGAGGLSPHPATLAELLEALRLRDMIISTIRTERNILAEQVRVKALGATIGEVEPINLDELMRAHDQYLDSTDFMNLLPAAYDEIVALRAERARLMEKCGESDNG